MTGLKWRMLSTVALGLMAIGSTASAQRPGNKNPIINNDHGATTKKAWIVKYGTQKQHGNNREDICVQLELTAKNGSPNEFVGTLYRYDRTATVGNDTYYQPVEGLAGKVGISGRAKPWDGNNKRRRLTFKAAGAYVDGDDVRVVKIIGFYNIGAKDDDRSDDSLSIIIHDQPSAHAPGQGNQGQGGNSGSQNTSVVRGEIFVSHYIMKLHPCEEEPDVDVLNEQTLADPPTAP